MEVEMMINGEEVAEEVEPRLPLVHFLRDTLGLNGHPVKSCTVLAVQADGTGVRTIEGLSTDGELHPLQEAFWNAHVGATLSEPQG